MGLVDSKEFPLGEMWDTAKGFVDQLTDAERIQFFYETFGTKVIGEKDSDGEYYWKGHYALAEVSREKSNHHWGEQSIDFMAPHDPDEWPNRISGDLAIAEAGICQECKSEYRSYVKKLICPVCKSKGYGT